MQWGRSNFAQYRNLSTVNLQLSKLINFEEFCKIFSRNNSAQKPLPNPSTPRDVYFDLSKNPGSKAEASKVYLYSSLDFFIRKATGCYM